ncbi:MAG: hypothetical protein MJ196_06170 [Treponemataceae bacterium]|nr:hypothetical protein [Treponemataceae bacterium]
MSQHNKMKSTITKNDIEVMQGIKYAINRSPLKRRIVYAWRVLWGKF